MNILQQIFEHKRIEVAEASAKVSLSEIRERAESASPVRPFRQALLDSPHDVGLIAEVKKASPSKGLIRADFDPSAIAHIYRGAGADCLSVLTDKRYFQGSLENLAIVREASGLPCLRKDFILDPYQVYEARAWGADCILLIVAGLETAQLRDLSQLAKSLGMDVLVEVHSMSEGEIAIDLDADLIGVNNRNLADMTTSLQTSLDLLPILSEHALTVSESALSSRAEIDLVRIAGARAVLIGTTFCAAPEIGSKVREVMDW